MWPLCKSVLVGGVGCGGFKDVSVVSDYLTEVFGASEFTTVVGSNRVVKLFNACTFEVKT